MSTAQRTLMLPLKAEYFYDIESGEKKEEFRLTTAYWRKRLEGREFDQIVFTLGYPPAEAHWRRLVRPWRGMRVTNITHPHFGPDPVEVFAIRAN